MITNLLNFFRGLFIKERIYYNGELVTDPVRKAELKAKVERVMKEMDERFKLLNPRV